MKSCCACGKQYNDGARGFDAERRRCKNQGPCVERALGPSPAKTVAAKMSQGQFRV